jgi:hypothetical protein
VPFLADLLREGHKYIFFIDGRGVEVGVGYVEENEGERKGGREEGREREGVVRVCMRVMLICVQWICSLLSHYCAMFTRASSMILLLHTFRR